MSPRPNLKYRAYLALANLVTALARVLLPAGPEPKSRSDATWPAAGPLRLTELVAQAKGWASECQPSLFWERQLDRFRSAESHSPLLDDAQISGVLREGLGYRFGQLADADGSARRDPNVVYATRVLDYLGTVRKRLDPPAMGVSRGSTEHAAALLFLRRHGLLDDYMAMLTAQGFTSGMTTARHFYHARLLQDLLTSIGPGPFRVLEIGAGAGNMAILLSDLGLVERYTIVDLPEMLLNSYDQVGTLLPQATLRCGAIARDGRSPTVLFLPPQHASQIESGSIDLALNFNSFMEMDRSQRDGYIELVYRVCRRGGLFVNINRRQPALPQRDGSTFDSNPLLYPYRSTDAVLRWEMDAFQQDIRSRFGEAPDSYAILRAAVIHSKERRR